MIDKGVLRELVEAYKRLVRITTGTMTAAQHADLLAAEKHLATALYHAASNPVERDAVGRFISKMMRREQGVRGL
jgi:hypothetical protein